MPRKRPISSKSLAYTRRWGLFPIMFIPYSICICFALLWPMPDQRLAQHLGARLLPCFSAVFFSFAETKAPAEGARCHCAHGTGARSGSAVCLSGGGEGRSQPHQFLCGRCLVLPASRPASHAGWRSPPEVPPALLPPSPHGRWRLCLLTGNSSRLRAGGRSHRWTVREQNRR